MTSSTKKPDTDKASMGDVVDFASRLQVLEKLISRRFDELSMEVNATSQQVDMAEEGIASRFSQILEILHAVSYRGDGNTPANAGIELDAVVDMTESAANTILDAADRINTTLNSDTDWSDDTQRGASFDTIRVDVENIFMACSFQDITSQRIKKTLSNLKDIEERLNTTLDKIGIKVQTPDTLQEPEIAASQDDVDALFSDNRDKD